MYISRGQMSKNKQLISLFLYNNAETYVEMQYFIVLKAQMWYINTHKPYKRY